jgi:phage-related protein
MNKSNYIAYLGVYYTIEWYFNEKGESQAFNYYTQLSNSQKRKLLLLFKRMGDFGKINDVRKFRYEGDDIFAFKPQPDRFLSFFVKNKKLIVTNGFHKKAQKLPQNEKAKALKYRKDYLIRVEEGKYYE